MDEKAKNAQTVKDAQAAQAAVAQATKVLEEFYAKAAASTAMVQTSAKAAAPEIFGDEPYTGMGGASGGVLGMMEVISSDFSRLETETTAEEGESQKEYEEFSNDTEVDKTSKSGDINHKTAKKNEQAEALVNK